MIFIAPLRGRQSIIKTRTAVGKYDYTANGSACGREAVYTILVSSGIPPGDHWFDILLAVADGTPEADTNMEPTENQEEYGDATPSRAYIAITFDNKLRELDYDEDEVTFVKQKLPDHCNYFINRIQCRAKDIREMFSGAGIKYGNMLYEILLTD